MPPSNRQRRIRRNPATTNSFYEKWGTLSDIIGWAINLAVAICTIALFKITNDSLTLTKESLAEAKRANDISENNLKIAQSQYKNAGPRLDITNVDIEREGQKNYIHFSLKNLGQRELEVFGKLYVTNENMNYQYEGELVNSTIFPGIEVQHSGRSYIPDSVLSSFDTYTFFDFDYIDIQLGDTSNLLKGFRSFPRTETSRSYSREMYHDEFINAYKYIIRRATKETEQIKAQLRSNFKKMMHYRDSLKQNNIPIPLELSDSAIGEFKVT